ncbi:unnamed protein product [Cyclocybe aegerita]|uniref:Uncharacterized protein n=1 Tax=Cyclocybe aegerita TaxID=1973307 RepID=A0A8S0WHJ8_CYCAE|nr:unnamed protein product [Cyclocybe aegerita]
MSRRLALEQTAKVTLGGKSPRHRLLWQAHTPQLGLDKVPARPKPGDVQLDKDGKTADISAISAKFYNIPYLLIITLPLASNAHEVPLMHSPVNYPSSLDTPSSYAARALYGQARGGSQDPLPLLPSWHSSPTPSLNPSTRKPGLESSSQSVQSVHTQEEPHLPTPVRTAVAMSSPSGIASPKESSIISTELPAGDTGEVQQQSATLANIIQFLAHALPSEEFRQPASPEEFQAIEKALHGGEIRSNYSSLRLNYFNDHIVITMPSLTHEIAAGLLQLSMNRHELAADTALSGGCPLVPVVGDQQLSADACFFSSSTPQHGRVAARKQGGHPVSVWEVSVAQRFAAAKLKANRWLIGTFLRTTNALVINLEVDSKPGERVLRSLRVTHWIGKWTPYEAPNEEELQHMKSVTGRVVDEEGNPLNERGAESRNIFFWF